MNYVSANSNKLGRVLGGWTNCKTKRNFFKHLFIDNEEHFQHNFLLYSLDGNYHFVSITEWFCVPTRRKVFLLLNHQYLAFIHYVGSLLCILKNVLVVFKLVQTFTSNLMIFPKSFIPYQFPENILLNPSILQSTENHDWESNIRLFGINPLIHRKWWWTKRW